MIVNEDVHKELLHKRVVADAMHPGVVTCPPEAMLAQVAHMMDWYRIHAIAVYGDSEDPTAEGVWGVVSDTDLLAALAAGDVSGRTAGGAARTPLVTVLAGEPLHTAAEQMAQSGVTHAVVVSPEGGRPVGILSTLDLAREFARIGWLER
jgi:CBS domain-containing protein